MRRGTGKIAAVAVGSVVVAAFLATKAGVRIPGLNG